MIMAILSVSEEIWQFEEIFLYVNLLTVQMKLSVSHSKLLLSSIYVCYGLGIGKAHYSTYECAITTLWAVNSAVNMFVYIGVWSFNETRSIIKHSLYERVFVSSCVVLVNLTNSDAAVFSFVSINRNILLLNAR